MPAALYVSRRKTGDAASPLVGQRNPGDFGQLAVIAWLLEQDFGAAAGRDEGGDRVAEQRTAEVAPREGQRRRPVPTGVAPGDAGQPPRPSESECRFDEHRNVVVH